MKYARAYRGKRSHIVTGFLGAYTSACGFTPAPGYAGTPGMWYRADPELSRYYSVCKACERQQQQADQEGTSITVIEEIREAE